jgi:hypothetical protein
MLGEAERNRLTDTTGPACYQGYLVVQTKPAHSIAPLRSTAKP